MRRLGLSRSDLGAIATGGVVGAVVRHWITDTRPTNGGWFAYAPNSSGAELLRVEPGLPLRTLVVNLAGCLLLGALTVMLRRSIEPNRRRVLGALAVGLCGSLTTFSTFAVDVAVLLREPTRSVPQAAVYLALSVGGGALAFVVGRAAVRATTVA